MPTNGLNILLISIHGLVRGREPELGRDPDTGGQVLYVLELARELGLNPEVRRVDLLTRRIEDPSIACDYALTSEGIGPNARILRLPFGPNGYIRKERLWSHLDQLVEGYLSFIQKGGTKPDVIHSHYADAGYVAMHLAKHLDVPHIHSAHSLGREKRERLLAAGHEPDALEQEFHFSHRIRVEENILEKADAIIASSEQELLEQYADYTCFDSARAYVIPPGTDLMRFHPPAPDEGAAPIQSEVDRFLAEAEKPIVLCIGRPAPRKNLLGLVRAFGEDAVLREQANLVLVAGCRADIRELDEVSRRTWEEILMLQDRYDLYGSLAIPKAHRQEDIPDLYRLASLRRGVCCNPAFSETFGLTMIEAAASGLPLVATNCGGPKEIVGHCENGLLTDVMDSHALAKTLRDSLSHPNRWDVWSSNGIKAVHKFYSWEVHVNRYLDLVQNRLLPLRSFVQEGASDERS